MIELKDIPAEVVEAMEKKGAVAYAKNINISKIIFINKNNMVVGSYEDNTYIIYLPLNQYICSAYYSQDWTNRKPLRQTVKWTISDINLDAMTATVTRSIDDEIVNKTKALTAHPYIDKKDGFYVYINYKDFDHTT